MNLSTAHRSSLRLPRSFQNFRFAASLLGGLLLSDCLLPNASLSQPPTPAATTPSATNSSATNPVPIIFDTDMGNDCDDALALGVIHALESRGECKLLAVTITKDHELAAPYVDCVNTFYGRGDIPIGVCRNSGKTPDPGKYNQVSQIMDNGQFRFPHDRRSPSKYLGQRPRPFRSDRPSRVLDQSCKPLAVTRRRDSSLARSTTRRPKSQTRFDHGGSIYKNPQ